MPKGGRIAISTEAVEVDTEYAQANSEMRPGSFVCLSVTDTGLGMDENTLQHIFEPFFTTKDVGRGTGLGLAMVYGIVAQHQGWLEVESHIGQGSTFRIYLPASDKAVSITEESSRRLMVKGHEGILLVEDEPSVRRMAAQALQLLGYRVFEAVNGQEALALWQENQGQIDLLFTDMVMPEGLTGMELAEKLRSEKPGLKVIISSGYSIEITEPGKFTAREMVYLPKPYRVSLLGKTVRDCLDQK